MLVEQAEDGRTAADLDVVGVGADGEQVERPGRSEGQAPHRVTPGQPVARPPTAVGPVSNAFWSAWTSLRVSIGAQ